MNDKIVTHSHIPLNDYCNWIMFYMSRWPIKNWRLFSYLKKKNRIRRTTSHVDDTAHLFSMTSTDLLYVLAPTTVGLHITLVMCPSNRYVTAFCKAWWRGHGTSAARASHTQHRIRSMPSLPGNAIGLLPANTHWQNVGLMLGQRRRQWPNIKPTLFQCVV